jgi:hypothetical protein
VGAQVARLVPSPNLRPAVGEEAAPDGERILRPDHPTTLTSRNNLGGAHRVAGDLTRAIPLFDRALADCERVLGPDHPTTGAVRANARAARAARENS